MCEAKKKRENIGKTWLLFLWIPHYKPYKKKCKIKNHLTIVFIWFIKQKLIKTCLFFYKNVVFFQLIISKKTTTILKKTMIKNLLPSESKTRLKTC